METIIIAVSVVLVLGGAVWAWWNENGPEQKHKDDERKSKIEKE